MNSPLIDTLSDSKSQIMQAYEKNNKNKDVLFVAIMGRPPTLVEKSKLSSVDTNDMIWLLVNSKEFLFKK